MIKLNNMSRNYYLSNRKSHIHQDFGANFEKGWTGKSFKFGHRMDWFSPLDFGVQRKLDLVDNKNMENLNNYTYKVEGSNDYLNDGNFMFKDD